jgi:hypothetical protein
MLGGFLGLLCLLAIIPLEIIFAEISISLAATLEAVCVGGLLIGVLSHFIMPAKPKLILSKRERSVTYKPSISAVRKWDFNQFSDVTIEYAVIQVNEARDGYEASVLLRGKDGNLIVDSGNILYARGIGLEVSKFMEIPLIDESEALTAGLLYRDVVAKFGHGDRGQPFPRQIHLSTAIILTIAAGILLGVTIWAFRARWDIAPLLGPFSIFILVMLFINLESSMQRRSK